MLFALFFLASVAKVMQNPAQQYSMAIFSLCIILSLHDFNYHQLAPAFYMASYAIYYQVSFTSLYT